MEVDDRTADMGTIIYIPVVSVPGRLLEDNEVMEHFPLQNTVIYPYISNLLINSVKAYSRVWPRRKVYH